MKKILFQGDSVTDSNRAKDEKWSEKYQGSGYPILVAAELGYRYPNEYSFYNRGISGNRVVDLLSRVKCDLINLKPDVVSILIGVNDVWHEINYKNGLSEESFERIYDILLCEIKEHLPNTQLMLLEPFVLQGEATIEHWSEFREEVEKRAKVTKKLAEKYNADFIALQSKFDKACTQAPAEYWLIDGEHPTSAGHKIIAEAWLDAFESLNF